MFKLSFPHLVASKYVFFASAKRGDLSTKKKHVRLPTRRDFCVREQPCLEVYVARKRRKQKPLSVLGLEFKQTVNHLVSKI